MSVEWNISAQTWTLSGGNTSYVLHRDAESRLLNLYSLLFHALPSLFIVIVTLSEAH